MIICLYRVDTVKSVYVIALGVLKGGGEFVHKRATDYSTQKKLRSGT
jgi:hypothetical protein